MRRLEQSRGIGLILLLGMFACSGKTTAARPAVRRSSEVPYELRLGKGIYAHYCQTCHGETGAGDGFNAFNLDPRPRDLSDPALQKKKSDADLADAIRRGGAGVGLTPLMPPWGHTLSGRQIDEVVLYLRTLRKQDAPQRPAPVAPGATATPAAR